MPPLLPVQCRLRPRNSCLSPRLGLVSSLCKCQRIPRSVDAVCDLSHSDRCQLHPRSGPGTSSLRRAGGQRRSVAPWSLRCLSARLALACQMLIRHKWAMSSKLLSPASARLAEPGPTFPHNSRCSPLPSQNTARREPQFDTLLRICDTQKMPPVREEISD
jgi:hypothetical protein